MPWPESSLGEAGFDHGLEQRRTVSHRSAGQSALEALVIALVLSQPAQAEHALHALWPQRPHLLAHVMGILRAQVHVARLDPVGPHIESLGDHLNVGEICLRRSLDGAVTVIGRIDLRLSKAFHMLRLHVPHVHWWQMRPLCWLRREFWLWLVLRLHQLAPMLSVHLRPASLESKGAAVYDG